MTEESKEFFIYLCVLEPGIKDGLHLSIDLSNKQTSTQVDWVYADLKV